MKLDPRTLFLTGTLVLGGCSGGESPDAETADPSGSAPEMPSSERMEAAAGAVSDMAGAVADAANEGATAAAVLAALAGDHRSEGNPARDIHRHPVETLTFFGITPEMTVVEVWPGGSSAWYTEVLAPTLRSGRLVAASYDTASEGYYGRAARAFEEKIESAPEVYDNVDIIAYENPAEDSLGAAASADAVLLFRLYHNAINGGNETGMMADAFTVLKPGGVLGVVQHRSPEDAPAESERRDGYVKESKIIADAEAAGFVLEARSEINANDEDTHDHPEGVWTLPPTLELCAEIDDEAEKAACTAEWRAIGESDRMTLKFVKPTA